LSQVSIWDVLRASETCFAWSTFASFESFWKRRIEADFGEKAAERVFRNYKNRYRELLGQKAIPLHINGISLARRDPLQLHYRPVFRLWKGPFKDDFRFVWMNFLDYLRSKVFLFDFFFHV
jgi:hypothetical protein